MGNSGLKAEVSHLQSELSSIEHENHRLKSEINTAIAGVNAADSDLNNYNKHLRNTLDAANQTMENSANKVVAAYELQGEIDHLYTRYKCVELANKKIRELNNKKYYEFNNYRTIRKIVQGMMDNLDLNMVSDQMIYKSIERQHLVTPDYWLTCALISIMAWKNDDKELAHKAVETAYKLDKKNSAIFYMIFNIRMQREEAAVKWFLEYQKCELKGSDENTFLMLFSLISKTISDKVDDETATMIQEFIHNLIVESAKKEGYSEKDIVQVIKRKLLMRKTVASYDLPTLAKYCTDYDDMVSTLNIARNNYNILEFILKIANVPMEEKNSYLKEYLNELLAKPNDVESETYNEIEYNEMIIRLNGDMETAKKKFKEELVHREADLNLISSMIRWIYDPNNENVNGQMRLNMFTLLKTLHEKSIESYCEIYRSRYAKHHPVQILDYHADLKFEEQGTEIGNVEKFYQEAQEGELAGIKNIATYVSFAIAGICTAASIFVMPLLLIGTLIGVGCGIGNWIGKKNKRKNIVLTYQKSKATVIEIVKKLCTEFETYQAKYNEYDAISAKIQEELAKL